MAVDDGDSDVNTARHIIGALQNRLMKMKDTVKRKEQRLRETRDQLAQLELKVKEKYFQQCEQKLLLNDVQQKLSVKCKEAEDLYNQCIQANADLKSALKVIRVTFFVRHPVFCLSCCSSFVRLRTGSECATSNEIRSTTLSSISISIGCNTMYN